MPQPLEEVAVSVARHHDDDITMNTLEIHDRKVKYKRSPVSTLLKGKGFDRATTGEPQSGKAHTVSLEEYAVVRKFLFNDKNFGKYEVVSELASGGMGAVYKVYDRNLHRFSVLKVILPDLKDNIDLIKRFIHEARISGELEHPNIVSVHDFGFLPGIGLYFAMNYIEGESLLDIIGRLQVRDPRYLQKYSFVNLIEIFRKICHAVAFAHSKNILHRDIKPANIIIGQYGEVILMDWGLAVHIDDGGEYQSDLPEPDMKLTDSVHLESTESGEIKGTPAYLSPEQASGDPEKVDKQTDVFLLGATLYHMFTFFPPYHDCPLEVALRRAQRCAYRHPQELMHENDRLSRHLCTIINKAMASDKEDRYPDVEALGNDLDDLLHEKMNFEYTTFSKGDLLINEGEIGDKCFKIVNGKVETFKTVAGDRVVLGTLGDGDIVGEMALITREQRTISAVALAPTKTIVLTKETFNLNLQKLPSWMEHSILALVNRLTHMSDKYTDSIVINRKAPEISNHPFRL